MKRNTLVICGITLGFVVHPLSACSSGSETPEDDIVKTIHCAAILDYSDGFVKAMGKSDSEAGINLSNYSGIAKRKFNQLNFENKDKYYREALGDVAKEPSRYRNYTAHCLKFLDGDT